jgi:isoleucyl-tRNA synthetase
VQVAFALDNDPDGAQMVAWTTTPWTLPSNLSLCVHPELIYVRVRQSRCGCCGCTQLNNSSAQFQR